MIIPVELFTELMASEPGLRKRVLDARADRLTRL